METEQIEPANAAKKLIKDMTTLGMEVSEQDQQEIAAAVTNEELARQFIEMRLDRAVDPAELMKMSLMSNVLWSKVNLPSILTTLSIYSLGHCRRILEHTDNLMQGRDQDGTKLERPLSEEGKLGCLRLHLLAAVEMSRMVPRAQKVAQLVQEPSQPKKPKNRPPNSLAPSPAMVQNNGGTVNLVVTPAT